jgi:hypothetical protein
VTKEYEIRSNGIGERCVTIVASSADEAITIWRAQPDDGHTDRTVPVHAVRVR